MSHVWFIKSRPDVDPKTGLYRESFAKSKGNLGTPRYLEKSLQRLASFADKKFTRDRTRVAQMLLDHGNALHPAQREVLEGYCRDKSL